MDENIKQVLDGYEDLKKELDEIKTERAAEKEKAKVEMEIKAEQLQRETAELAKNKNLQGEKKYKAPSKYHGFINARKEVLKGKTQKVTDWDEDTEKKFVDYIYMLKDGMNDKEINKALGDNPYTETTTAGGYLVPTIFKPELIRLIYLKSMALQKCKIIPMPTSKVNLPGVTTGYTAAWGTINTAVVDAKATLGQTELSAEKILGLSLVPNELMQDSMLPIAQLLADEFSEAFAKLIDYTVFQGDTSATYKFNGWENADNVVGDTLGDSEITPADLINICGATSLEDSQLDGAEWFFHPTVWSLVRGLDDSNSNPIVQLDRDYSYNLLGFNVNRSAQVPSGGDSAGVYCFFGNPKNIIIGDLMDFSLQQSSEFRMDYDQTAFLAKQRLAIAVTNATALVKGLCEANSAIT